MKGQEVREKFTQYFIDNGHEKITSSSLIPQNDPTLLFANAGMNQFKDYFTGTANPKNKRATSIQKCVRAGGKHNDLENVGFTARHHTFFEMLGNFSFGDYFKHDAIKMAWKFLTVELKIPKEKLYVTVHISDQDAADIWHNQEGVPKDRIFFLDEDNFWEMGDIGPCGPSSEIFYDHGIENSDGSDTTSCILNDEGRYVEIWNLVFMQYEKFKDGDKVTRRDLPKPSVDTGAGLERIAAVMQGKYWNYDSDIFAPIISKLEELSRKKYADKKYESNFRVVSDHIRSAVMLITDGVMPSNEGRGYVLRRIIRRGIRNLEELGLSDISFYKLIPSVFVNLGKEYPQNAENVALAEKLLKVEEEKFRQTLKTGLELIKKEITSLKAGDQFSGVTAFKLYDTFGFPIDLTETILLENKLELNKSEFDESMAIQKASSKKSNKFATQENDTKKFYQIFEKHGATEFIGYDQTSAITKLIAIEEQGDYTALVFDKTPFYGESGGQAGDSGKVLSLDKNDILAEVVDTQKPVEGLFVQYCKNVQMDSLKIGSEYELVVTASNRSQVTKNHSATHLLQAALIEVLGDHVKQAGSNVTFDRLRFDYTHTETTSAKQLKAIEKLINEKIGATLDVSCNVMTKDEATEKGAMALFGEKYGDEVRVVQMGNFSTELCGGTHVANTQDISLFVLLGDSSLSSGIRRIEAVTSSEALKYLNERSNILNNLEKSFSVKGHDVVKKITSLQDDIKAKNKTIKDLHDKIQSIASRDLFSECKKLDNGIGLVSVNLENGSSKDFRSLSDKFVDQNKEDILLLYKIEAEKISYLIRTDKKNKSVNCSNVMKEAQEVLSGRGGGRPDMGQGSGESANYLEFITKVETILKGL